MAGRRGLFVRKDGSAGTSPQGARLALAGLVTPSGDLGVIPGVFSGCIVSGNSDWTYTVSAGHFQTTRGASDGVAVAANDGATLTSAVATAPATGSRWDLIWIRQRDIDNGDADSTVVVGVTSGTSGGSPTKPYGSVPAGALVLAEAQVAAGATQTAHANVTIAQVAARVAARGGIISLPNSAAATAMLGAGSTSYPQYGDLDGVLVRSDGTTWRSALTLASGTWNLAGNLSIPNNTYTVFPAVSVVETPTPGKLTNTSGAITVADAGVYEVDVAVRWPGTATAPLKRLVGVAMNCPSISSGGALASGTMLSVEVSTPTGTADFTQRFRSRRFTLAAGDVLRVFLAQDSGGTLVVGPGLNDALGFCSLGVYRVA